MTKTSPMDRRGMLATIGAVGAATWLAPAESRAQTYDVSMQPIPLSGETVPAVGLGTWITFNVGDDPEMQDACAKVMAAFFEDGGRMIDSSPMYGSSQSTIGHGLNKLGHPQALFSAEKVWTSSGEDGPAQIEQSRTYWDVPRFDLLQVHNLRGWQAHLETLFAMKQAGRLRYVGITTSEGRRHDEFAEVMRSQPLDFVQITYNPLDREVEDTLLLLAQERGMGVIVNRPFRQGALTEALEGYELPPFAAELGCKSWAQLILKFIVSHPAVTCAIPATTRVDHVRENMAAARGPMPDEPMRQRIVEAIEAV
ncbi:aldo/keto reductase [Marinivivus vitaminiproducens]|uniref:aldo/keto reductase n=1 Tax=Marinivivus vitaminiproducens TaxID=3035935 RepID=UPI0027A3AC88|nr:aldo/keto reductase [Geminicoccaceae bacterium SCSIO 64248]